MCPLLLRAKETPQQVATSLHEASGAGESEILITKHIPKGDWIAEGIGMEVTKVRDAEHWGQVLDLSDKKLLVVDAHKDWCGPCKVMEPTYKRLSAEIEAADRRIAFASLNVNLNVDGVEDSGSCKPRFLLFKERKPVGEVAGANAPHLEQLIKQHCPPPPNDDEEN